MMVLPATAVFGLATLTRKIEVTYQGQYSVQRLQELATYQAETSTTRAVVVLVFTLVPCVAAATVVDALPLEPPTNEIDHSPMFVVRLYESIWLFSVIILAQFRHYVPALKVSSLQIVVTSSIVSAAATSCDILLIWLIGFPLPFTFFVCSAVWVPFMVIGFLILGVRKVLSNDQHKQHMSNSVRLFLCQYSLIAVWPLYFIALIAAPESAKPAVMLVLPLMKVVLRRGFSRALPHLRDEAPEIVIFNTDVFSSLFFSVSAQSTTILVTVGLIILDGINALWSVKQLFQMHKKLVALDMKNEENIRVNSVLLRPTTELPYFPVSATLGILDRSTLLIEKVRCRLSTKKHHTKSQLKAKADFAVAALTLKLKYKSNGSRVSPVLSTPQLVQRNQILASKLEKIKKYHSVKALRASKPSQACIQDVQLSTIQSSLSIKELEFVNQTQRYLYLMEFVLLLNYVEAAIPLVYGTFHTAFFATEEAKCVLVSLGTYVMITYNLPNRKYYAQFSDLGAEAIEHTQLNLLLYFGMQMISLLMLCSVCKAKFNVSGIKQIAFVLERQWVDVQLKLTLWLFYNAQTSLAHSGKSATSYVKQTW